MRLVPSSEVYLLLLLDILKKIIKRLMKMTDLYNKIQYI